MPAVRCAFPLRARFGIGTAAALLGASAGLLGCGGQDAAAPPTQGVPAGPEDASASVPPTNEAESSATGVDATALGLPPGPVGPDTDAGAAPAARDASRPSGSEAGARVPREAGAASPEAGVSAGAGPEQCAKRAALDPKWKLAWSDEFDQDGAPNPANWGFEKGFVRNEELQWYQPDNATVANGLLTIAAQKQQVLNPNYVAGSSSWKTSRQYAQYTSTSMTTSGKHAFTYGRFEVCAKIDTRQGSWPAFWSLGSGVSWPASGEVDIMEYYAKDVRANVCKPSGSTCDWSGSVAQPLSSFASDWANSFHLWAMEWDSTNLVLYLDDKSVYPFKVSSAVSSGTNPYVGHSFYVLVNLAIGANGGDPTNTTFPLDYLVDYVRVYQ
jgi:beta-glucanase (GH16 family)